MMNPNIFHTLQDSMIVSIRDRCFCSFTAQNFTKIQQFTSLRWGIKGNVQTFFNMGKKQLFKNFILILWTINFIILRIDIPFFDDLPGSNSHLSEFPFRHLWQEQIFSFPIIRPSGEKAIMCIFSHCKILNFSLGFFLIFARWS